MATERVHVFLLVRLGGKPQKVIVWDTPDITVGRAPENDVVIQSEEASREHACFYRSDAGYSVRNHSMSNPTFVNGEAITSRPLQNKDVVRVAETELVFCRVPKNPVTLGLPVEYASQLKGFGPKVSGDGEATILGLMDTVEGEEDFVVKPAADFEHELHGVEPPKTRNLDLEIANDGLDDLDMPPTAKTPAAAPGIAAWTLEEKSGQPGSVSLTLEIEGLTPEQRASVQALLGKVIELPRLRIRVKGRDLG